MAWLGLQLASALRYVDRHGLLHLDVKPSNIIADAGRAVSDRPLAGARSRGAIAPASGPGATCRPNRPAASTLTTAADVWGLGTVLYEAVTGEPAFKDDATVASSDDTWQTEGAVWDAGFPQFRSRPAPPRCARPCSGR